MGWLFAILLAFAAMIQGGYPHDTIEEFSRHYETCNTHHMESMLARSVHYRGQNMAREEVREVYDDYCNRLGIRTLELVDYSAKRTGFGWDVWYTFRIINVPGTEHTTQVTWERQQGQWLVTQML